MLGLQNEIARSYNSFAGSDIKAIIGQFQFAELQAISYAITREKAPIYTMGSPDPRAYSRNKRGIAGNLIWLNFDRHALLNLFHKARGRYVADVDEIRPQFSLDAPDANALFASSIVRGAGLSIGDTIDKLDTQVPDIYGLNELAEPGLLGPGSSVRYHARRRQRIRCHVRLQDPRRRDPERRFGHLGGRCSLGRAGDVSHPRV